MALSTGQIISGAGVIARKQREGEEAERIAQANQLRIEALNRAELLRGEKLQAEMPGLRMPTYDPGMYRTDVEQITAPVPSTPDTGPVAGPSAPAGARDPKARGAGVAPTVTTPQDNTPYHEALYGRLRDRISDADVKGMLANKQQFSDEDVARLYAIALSNNRTSGGFSVNRADDSAAYVLGTILAERGVDPKYIKNVRDTTLGARRDLRKVEVAEAQDLRKGEERRKLFELKTGRKVGTAAGSEILTPAKAAAPSAAATPVTPVTPAPPSAGTSLSADQAKIRGFRNNNPGNLRPSGDQWQGMVGVDTKDKDGAFIVFDSPESGIRALAKNLLTYQRNGVNTIEEIISRWAPASDNNNTEGYIKFVSDRLGVPRNATLNVQDANTMQALVRAIITKENGVDPYSDQTLLAGINAAYSGAPVAPAAGVAPTATAAAVPQPPREFFGARPEAVSNQIKQSLRQRDELVRMANMYRNSGMGDEYMQVRQQVMALDENMLYLQGMQGLSEFSFGNDPGRLSAAWSAVTDNNIRIQPRTDGKFNLLVNGKKIQDGMTESEVTQAARSSFDTAYVQAMQQHSAEANMERYKSVLRREEAMVTQQAQGTRELQNIQAEMVANVFTTQAKGNIDMGIEMIKQNGFKVQSNQDGTLTIIPPYGQVPFIYNPAGQVVEMPDGTKVTSFMAQRIAGLPAPANVSRQ